MLLMLLSLFCLFSSLNVNCFSFLSKKPECRLSMATQRSPNEHELLSESHFLSRFNGFVLDVIPAAAAKYLEDDDKNIKWKNEGKVEKYLKELTSQKVAAQPPVFVSVENLMKILEEEDAHYFCDQETVNSISQMYLPELEIDDYEEFNVVMTEDMFYVAFPDKLNTLMQRTDMNPMREVKITRDFVDEVVNDEEELRGLFPKPSTVDLNILHIPDHPKTQSSSTHSSSTRSKATEGSSLFKDLEVYVAEGAASALKPTMKGSTSKLSQGRYSPQPYAWRKGVNLSKLKKTLEKDPNYFKH